MAAKWAAVFFLCFGFCAAWLDERPVLESRDGHLYISSAKDRNITLKILGKGFLNVNDINLLHIANSAEIAVRFIERWKTGSVGDVEENLIRLSNIIEGPSGLQKRVTMLELGLESNGTTQRASTNSPGSGDSPASRSGLRRLNDRIQRLEDRVREIVTKLREDDCAMGPCLHGGTCVDLYEGYQCHCPSNWEGQRCSIDVNECARLLGTDLGCQNGATCVNTMGSYQCNCAPGWYGFHCTRKTSVCNTQNSEELCGHGVCVSKPGSLLGYTCICDQGWESDGTNPACVKDVDECAAKHPPCSVSPPVPCINVPGAFYCGGCPHGFTGNGYYCADIDECITDNGGCSTEPRVQCINTMGSRVCGSCPPGYQGDGVSCTYVGACHINNGGCHPLATCTQNPGMTSTYTICRCPPGFHGDGYGPQGCQQGTTDVSPACASNPCVHGVCRGQGTHGFTCICDRGYTGPTCSDSLDACSQNPCKNGGTCVVRNGQAVCDCPTAYSGRTCDTPKQSCGGVLRNPIGRLRFPGTGTVYQHGLSCAWMLITNHTQVLNVTFTSFNIEASTDCKYDFLQIHDGRNAGSHAIGRFCGSEFPNKGNIVSSHNALYFWFNSDSSLAHDGFTFEWNSIDPVCGGEFTDRFGTIVSPGYPGRYPPNRDCYWYIYVDPSKRVQFHFGQLMLEEDPTCEHDYVEITDLENKSMGRYCNHSRPEPLMMPGPYAELHFHSDGSTQDAGFQIHYATVEGLPGCGGTYTADKGMITSPGDSTSYLPRMECEWKIQMPAGERIRISWLKFDLEQSRSCRFDYVQVFDGPGVDSPSFGKFCGDSLPPTIKSTTNVLTIVFVSDWSYEAEGFKLNYEKICGAEFTESTGILTSPNYPNGYPSGLTCVYEIIQPAGKGITLAMLDMDIERSMDAECWFDALKIYDGDNENSTRLAELCGSSDQMPNTPFQSSSNYMYLVFTTDSSVSANGWRANYTTFDRRCGGLLKTPTGVIEPSKENGFYSNNEHCVWIIRAPPGHAIELSWLSLELEEQRRCHSDYVSVYEGFATDGTEGLLGNYCGRNTPPTMNSQGETMTVVFHTDSSITYGGFTANYAFVDATRSCGGHYFALTGTLKSPNYPNEYPHLKECNWIIEAPKNQRVTLLVRDFNLENSSSCYFDYLEIRNGGYDTSPLFGKYCGINIPEVIESFTSQIYIKFQSDSSRSAPGFRIDWHSNAQGCGGTVSAGNGDIVSPNYPQPYSQRADCTWTIAVSPGNLIRIVVVDLELEEHMTCRYDYIEIYEGNGRTRNTNNRYCGTNSPGVIDVQSNVATVHFRSDVTSNGRGFHIRYETLCRNKVKGFGGAIASPNFPNDYQDNANCSWVIEVPIGNKINLTFSHFEVEGRNIRSCNFDYLEVQEGSKDVPTRNLGKFCGIDKVPDKIHSTENQVFLNFRTDDYIVYAGFRLEWVIDGCGGRLSRPTGTFTSPGYPFEYPENVDCEWLIEVAPISSIQITINEINTERRSSCRFDKIQVYAGSDDTAPLLGEVCFSQKPVVYTSPGSNMFVRFHSDVSMTGQGFSATYESVPLQCGGKFTANSGVIHSTNYPKNYPHLQNCEWLLEVDDMHVVNITFEDFDVEASRNCSDDYVKIFDGPTKDYPVLGTHCRNGLPPSYLSTGNQMLVVMRTDSMISAKGFKAKYQKSCGARIVVKDQGFITTATDSYDTGNLNCTWILTTEDPADHVVLSFTHIDMEPSYIVTSVCATQFVEAIEGEPDTGISLGKWCDNRVPPSITSTGNTLTVRLFNDEHYNEGLFSATFSLLNSACGGNYSSEHGSIVSPGYPNSYPLGAECVWILQTSPGNRISLSFSKFDLEDSEHCNLDYLEIREESGIGKLIGTYCGKNIDTVTSSKLLWVKFRSDNSGTATGFKADYSFIHGNELSGPTGDIASPLYPKFFRTEGTYNWRVSVEFGWTIRVEFKQFYIHRVLNSECTSYVRIYDGYNSEAPPLTPELCGFAKPSPVQSQSNIIYIEMVSTYPLKVGNYFYLSWLQMPRDSDGAKEIIELSKCDEEIPLSDNKTVHTLTSPGEPNGYEPNLDCNWVFTSEPGTHLRIRFLSMDIEESSACVSDSVSVYDGNARTSAENAVLLKKLCLSNSTYITVNASNLMTVKFHTDSSVNKTGFRAMVYRDCGGKLSGPNGVIEINNSTRVVRTWRISCEWVVEVKPGKNIEVEIVTLDIHKPNPEGCSDNYLLLRNGGESTSPFLGDGKFCGDEIPPILTTIGNRLFVKTIGTKDTVNFKLKYKEKGMECGGNYVLTHNMKTIVIETPNNPNVPPPYTECFWTVMAPSGVGLNIHFMGRFDLASTVDCEKEYVEVRDGGTDIANLLGRYCSDTAPGSMSTTGNMMYIHYYTEMTEPKNGFTAVINSGDSCSGILRSPSGIIHSPNYPNSYPNNVLCAWLIIAPEGHSLKLQFLDMHLPGLRRCESTDNVTIAEKNEENGTMTDVGVYCGNMIGTERTSPIIDIDSNEALITFKSDDRNTIPYKGFLLNYTASRDACGGELTAPAGIIKSPGYPNPRLQNRYCEWRITLAEGTQVAVDVLDVDLGGSDDGNRMRDTLSFYNDFGYKSKIVSLNQAETVPSKISSSSNTMRIVYWSRRAHRGFKLRYYAWAPAPCGGKYTNMEGLIRGPDMTTFNRTTYYCNWLIKPPQELLSSSANTTGLTLTVAVTGTVSNYVQRGRRCYRYSYVTMKDIGDICGSHSKPVYLRSPNIVNKISILETPYGGAMNANVSYRWQQCGGILNGESHTITAPKNLSYPISCAWDINYPDAEEVMFLSFKSINLGNCDKSYITVRKGGPFSPLVGTFCGNILPPNITSTSNRLWVEYFSTAEPNDFEIDIQLGSAGCGLPMRGSRREISSPNFPQQYPNNAECEWEIVARNGYHVGLTFVDRFNMESSQGCEKDFVQIFDWQPSLNETVGVWKDLGKLCGRYAPPAFNSTSNRMKVLFRTNEAVQGDGFKAKWWQNCGGVFVVTKTPQYITSPGYPQWYDTNLNCNYTFVAPEEDIALEFLDFNIENGRQCMYDNVTIVTRDTWDNEESKVYCRNKPALQRSMSRIEIIFKTDNFIQRSGFQIKYSITNCGGIVTEPTTLEPLMNNNEYFSNLNCTWVIKAPAGKSVTLRFEKFITEYSSVCYYDYVNAYEGEVIDEEKLLGHVCGNLTARLPVFKSQGNSMVVHFKTDYSGERGGFRAEVLFGTSAAAGCGGNIDVAPGATVPFKTQQGSQYESLEDCHWTVRAPEGQVLKFTFTHMDLKNRTNSVGNECLGDYLELHDGGGPYSEPLGKFCGDTIPGPVATSANVLWIRLYTDGTLVGTGVTGTIQSVPSLCGPATRLINDTKQILSSPGYPNNYPAGTKCRWTLRYPSSYSRDRILIHFLDFDMADSPKCENDGLEIIDEENHVYIGEGFGQNFVYSGTRQHMITMEMGTYAPISVYKYCGSTLPHEYYSNPYSTTVELAFKAMTGGHKGFKLEFATVSCDRNYTSEQGRIVHQAFSECWITITAPVGHTISMYFNTFRLYSGEQCTDAGMQVREGDFSGRLLGSFCGMEVPSPVFSTGNQLSLHSWSERDYSYVTYDITYTTTDKGRGCGGRLFNYGGRFTSPLYPNNYRNDSECTWDVIVPRSYKAVLHFTVFDLGTAQCTGDYVRITDVMEDGTELVRSTFCSTDTPARIESDTNHVKVLYKSSVNNGGSGWVIVFMGLPSNNQVKLANEWY